MADVKVKVENDRPINNRREDFLNRNQFALKLAAVIDGYTEICNSQGHNEGLVIGLEGAWGSGKTSLLRLLKPLLREKLIVDVNKNSQTQLSQEEKLKRQKYYVVDFNSWLAMDENALVADFFYVLQNACKLAGLENPIGVIKYAGHFIKDRAGVVADVVQAMRIPGVSEVASGTKALLDAMNQERIGEQKKKLSDELRSLGDKWIVFCIDDLDRLQDKEIATVFKLVKNIADFPNIIYVLAYDKEVVIQALDSVQKKKGKEYLQKVVQFPFAVPEPQKALLDDYLTDNLRKVCEGKGKDFVDREHLQEMYVKGVRTYIRTLRDCKRILNAFFMRYFAGGQECDAGDLLGITILELYEPEVFNEIKRDKEILAYDHSLPYTDDQVERMRALYGRIVRLFAVNEGIRIFRMLFPQAAEAADHGDKPSPVGGRARAMKRICLYEFFDMYFTLQVDFKELTQEEIDAVFQKENEENIRTLFLKWKDEGRLSAAFDSLSDFLDAESVRGTSVTFSASRVLAICKAVSAVSVCSEDKESLFEICNTRTRFINSLFWKLFLMPQPIQRAVWDSFFDDEGISLSVLGTVLYCAGVGQPWKFGSVSLSDVQKVLSGKEFAQLTRKFLQRIHLAEENKTLLRVDDLRSILAYWEALDNGDYCRFLQSLSNPEDLATVVFVYMRGPTSAYLQGIETWRVGNDWPKTLDRGVVRRTLEAYIGTEAFLRLPKLKREAVFAFCLLSKNNGTVITRSEVQRRMSAALAGIAGAAKQISE